MVKCRLCNGFTGLFFLLSSPPPRLCWQNLVDHWYRFPNLATAIRTSVILIFTWLIAFATAGTLSVEKLSGRTWLFLVLSGIATGPVLALLLPRPAAWPRLPRGPH